jgi:Rrf2 family protein
MRVSAKSDYAVRAAILLAAADGGQLTREEIASAQEIPERFLEHILLDLKRAGLVETQRGRDGGCWLARASSEISVADVVRAVDGPLANVRDRRPEQVEYAGAAAGLSDVWVALRVSMRRVLEAVTLKDLVEGRLPRGVKALLADPEARRSH